MKKRDALFSLIKSMTKSEKRYFTISMMGFQPNREKYYLSLFNAIDAQDVYDEQAIKKKFKHIPHFKHLPRIKMYLFEQVLKSLRNFHDKSSCEMKLNNYLSEIEILFRKKLIPECTEWSRKAKEYANKYELLTYSLNVINWELSTAVYSYNMEQLEQVKREACNERQNILSQCQEITEMHRIYLDTQYIVQTNGEARKRDTLNQLDELMKHPLMNTSMKNMSVEHCRIGIKAMRASLVGDIEELYQCTRQTVQIIEGWPQQLPERLNSYVHHAVDLAFMCVDTHRPREAFQLFEKLKHIMAEYPNEIDFRYHFALHILEMDLYRAKGEFDKAVKLIPKLARLAKTRPGELDPVTELIYHQRIFRTYFDTGDFKNAQDYIQKIIYSSHQQVRVNSRTEARILNLILQFEQGEYLHLGYVLRSTYRHLLKNKSIYLSEAVIINFLKSAIRFSSRRELLTGLTGLRTELMKLKEEPFENNFLPNFPLIDWIDSKLQKKTFAEINCKNYMGNLEIEEKMQPETV